MCNNKTTEITDVDLYNETFIGHYENVFQYFKMRNTKSKYKIIRNDFKRTIEEFQILEDKIKIIDYDYINLVFGMPAVNYEFRCYFESLVMFIRRHVGESKWDNGFCKLITEMKEYVNNLECEHNWDNIINIYNNIINLGYHSYDLNVDIINKDILELKKMSKYIIKYSDERLAHYNNADKENNNFNILIYKEYYITLKQIIQIIKNMSLMFRKYDLYFTGNEADLKGTYQYYSKNTFKYPLVENKGLFDYISNNYNSLPEELIKLTGYHFILERKKLMIIDRLFEYYWAD